MEPTLEQAERASQELGRALRGETTPAPLDPSKVKAGDTVTVTQRTAVVTDEVASVSQGPHWHFDLKVYPATVILGVPGGDDGLWTLTAHQPAPEALPTTNGSIVIRNVGYSRPEFHLIGDQWRGSKSGNVGNPNSWADGWTLVRDAAAPDEPRPLPTVEQIAETLYWADRLDEAGDRVLRYGDFKDAGELARKAYLRYAGHTLALLRGESA